MHCYSCGRSMTHGESYNGRQAPWYCNGCSKTGGRCCCASLIEAMLAILGSHETMGCCDPKTLEHVAQSFVAGER